MCKVPCFYLVYRVDHVAGNGWRLSIAGWFSTEHRQTSLIKPLVTDSGSFWQAFRQTLG